MVKFNFMKCWCFDDPLQHIIIIILMYLTMGNSQTMKTAGLKIC